MANQKELESLYGKAGTVHLETIRVLCRSRLEGMNDIMTNIRLRKGVRECKGLAEAIRQAGGNGELAQDLDYRAHVMEWWVNQAPDLHRIIRRKYKSQYGFDDDGQETLGMTSNVSCPYEDDPNGRKCWGCKVPVRVWSAMRKDYENQ
jgi:hypothetical protein